MTSKAWRVCLLFLSVCPAYPAELELRYGALERIIAEQLFTQEGRHYVRGSQASKCQFAYLETPHVGAEEGRLRVTARFSGRTALDVFGRCVGLGDSFDLTVTASPIVRNGAIAFKDVKVTATRDSYYIRRVRAALSDSISRDFKIEVKDQARRLLEQTPPRQDAPAPKAPSPDPGPSKVPGQSVAAPKAPYQQDLAKFDLGDVQVTPDALVLVVEFRLVVK